MKKIEIQNKILELSKDLQNKNKEIEELQISLRGKKIEVRKLKNQISSLRLDLDEIEVENWKQRKQQKAVQKNQKSISNKYMYGGVRDKRLREELYSQYYSQDIVDKCVEDNYLTYIQKNIEPYID